MLPLYSTAILSSELLRCFRNRNISIISRQKHTVWKGLSKWFDLIPQSTPVQYHIRSFHSTFSFMCFLANFNRIIHFTGSQHVQRIDTVITMLQYWLPLQNKTYGKPHLNCEEFKFEPEAAKLECYGGVVSEDKFNIQIRHVDGQTTWWIWLYGLPFLHQDEFHV